MAEATQILLVEDDIDHAELIRRAFVRRNNGTQLTLVRSLYDAQHFLGGTRPNLVISDFRLPDGQGTDLLQAADGRPVYPVVIMTSQGDEAVAVLAMKQGALDYVVKSETSLADMPRIADRALREWQLITERQRAEAEIRKLNAELERRVQERTAALEAANRDLATANRELEAFTYSISHDLRAPLRAIDGFAQIVSRSYGEHLDERRQRYLGNIEASCAQMARMIDDLLRYARLGRKAVRRQPVALSTVVQQVHETLAERIAATNGSIICPAHLPVIAADPLILSQIFTNLFENALTYHRPGVPPRVTVTCEHDEEGTTLCVADNGIGIAETYYERIFNVFQRLHSIEDYEGTGIGLAIVKKMADLLGGRVWVVSESGKGSAFYVYLPTA